MYTNAAVDGALESCNPQRNGARLTARDAYFARVSTTPSERKALLFLASLLALGALARMVSAARREHAGVAPNPGALERQIAAVDSERVRVYDRRRRAGAPRGSPRARGGSRATPVGRRPRTDSVVIVDVDRASAEELEALPRVGPALARRIIQDREQHGAFGSLHALMRVNGIGPKLVTQLAAHVTFSASVRPPSALSEGPGAVPRVGRSPPPG
jgi:competence protein ComEA